jgi:MbtH-like protein
MHEPEEDMTIYKVVLNHEEQYSIWPADHENPLGWRDVGKARFQTGLFGVYQTSVDGYAPIEHTEANGCRPEQLSG